MGTLVRSTKVFILKRKPSHLFLPRPSSTSPTAHNTHLVFSFSTVVADQISPPKTKTLFITKYLIDTIGFSPDKAIKASKSIAHVKSPSKPDAVLGFLKHSGWSDADIRNLVIKRPDLLCTNVEKTLKPKLEALGDLGLSQSEQISLALGNPNVFRVTDLQPKIAFLKTVFGTNEKMLKAITSNYYLLSLGKRIIPNLEILRECGISNAQITKLLSFPRFITNHPDSIKASIKRVDDLGVPRLSGMFGLTLRSIINVSKTAVNTRVRLLKSLGWSETEVFTTFRKMPTLLTLSEEMIRSKVEFLTKDLGWDISDIASCPMYLGFSMERRLVPRHCVLKTLKQEELITGGKSAFKMNEKMFINKFILPYKDKLPLLHEAYSAAVGNAPKMHDKI